MSESCAERRRLEVRELFTELITAYGQKEFDTFGSFLTEDTLFEWPYRPLADFPASMVGGEAFVAASREGMESCLPYGHKVDRFYDQCDPDTLIVEYHTATTHIPSNKAYANRYLGILRFEGDKVVYWKEYVNPLPILEVYGAEFSNASALEN